MTLTQPVVGAAETAPAAAPHASVVAPAAGLKAHVNTDVARTYLYRYYYGEETVNDRFYGPCKDFYYDQIVNGRYHAYELGGWISTDKAGSGWCSD
ncbi:MAG: hypothetical protein WBA97_06250 [Actinophytocola sp.]|uniref:hypothetical protein n=1 Tax=Actinophytocola sp. TaxID=1872138 RepID=UPI003C755ACA